MPERLPPHLQLALASIPVFTDDGRLDQAELERLLEVAHSDGVVDEEERRVLENILRRAEAGGVDASTRERIERVRSELGLSR